MTRWKTAGYFLKKKKNVGKEPEEQMTFNK